MSLSRICIPEVQSFINDIQKFYFTRIESVASQAEYIDCHLPMFVYVDINFVFRPISLRYFHTYVGKLAQVSLSTCMCAR